GHEVVHRSSSAVALRFPRLLRPKRCIVEGKSTRSKIFRKEKSRERVIIASCYETPTSVHYAMSCTEHAQRPDLIGAEITPRPAPLLVPWDPPLAPGVRHPGLGCSNRRFVR